MTSGAMNFARRLIYLKRDQLIDFEQRPYLSAMYGSSARNIVVRAARQVEKSTYLAAMILYLAATHAGIQILYVCPRREQAQLFARTRVITAIADSPILC